MIRMMKVKDGRKFRNRSEPTLTYHSIHFKMSLCRSCLNRLTSSSSSSATVRRSSPIAARAIHNTYPRRDTDELAKAKARAWYLDHSPPTPTPQAGPSSKPTPRFTTFDPESTRSAVDAITIQPLPANATSPILVQLHEHLTSQSDSVDASSVRFLHAPSSRLLRSQAGLEDNEALLGESGGTNWEWIVTCQVKGRGRGVLNRAEKEIRKWVRFLQYSNQYIANLSRCARHLEREHVQELHREKRVIRIGQWFMLVRGFVLTFSPPRARSAGIWRSYGRSARQEFSRRTRFKSKH
jgi:hypothetical protein